MKEEKEQGSSAPPRISVIVPVYNTEKYLHRCIDSVLAQTYRDFELLLIDDGSTDSSGAICDEYAEKDGRVRVFHKENGGVSSARRIGVENSNGEYVYFVDSDDSIYIDAFQEMLTLAHDDVDIVVFDSRVDGSYSSIEYAEQLLNFQDWAVWSKLYRRTLFDSSVFDLPREIRVGEDFIMNLRLLRNVRGNIVCRPTNKYMYNVGTSTSAQASHKSTYEYEKKIVGYADKAVRQLPFDNSLMDKLFHWKLEYLKGVIGYRYQVIYSDSWIQSLLVESASRKLSLLERITIKAAEGKEWARKLLYSYRSLKNMVGTIKRRIYG